MAIVSLPNNVFLRFLTEFQIFFFLRQRAPFCLTFREVLSLAHAHGNVFLSISHVNHRFGCLCRVIKHVLAI